jgi:hypothetical protein
MHLHFERNTNAKCDCAILSLTWMGKVPDELPEVSVTLVAWLYAVLIVMCCDALLPLRWKRWVLFPSFGWMDFWATSGNDNLQAADREKKSYQIITGAGNAVCYYSYIRGIFIKALCLCGEKAGLFYVVSEGCTSRMLKPVTSFIPFFHNEFS